MVSQAFLSKKRSDPTRSELKLRVKANNHVTLFFLAGHLPYILFSILLLPSAFQNSSEGITDKDYMRTKTKI